MLTELEEIERYKTEQLSGAYLYLGPASLDKSHRKDTYSSNMGMTKTEIKNLIKSMMPSIQTQPISSQLSQSNYRLQPPGTSQIIHDTNMGRFIQWLTGEIPGFVPIPKPDLPPKPVTKKVEITNNDPVEDMHKQLEDLHINQTKIAKATVRDT